MLSFDFTWTRDCPLAHLLLPRVPSRSIDLRALGTQAPRSEASSRRCHAVGVAQRPIRSAVISCSPLSNIEQISIQLRCNIFAGWVSHRWGFLMPESQLTVHGKRPIGMREPRAFGVEDRPPCPSCGAEMYLFRRSPEPGHHAYEVQIFSCMKCDAEITRSADRMGKPHLEGVLGVVRLLNIDATSIKRTRTALPAPSMVNDEPINGALGGRSRQRGAPVSK
jgi:hypothetical protein